MFTRATLQLTRHLFVFDGEVELVRLDGGRAVLRVVSRLYQPALVGLEDVTLVNKEVHLPCFHATTKNEIELDKEPSCQSQNGKDANAQKYFT